MVHDSRLALLQWILQVVSDSRSERLRSGRERSRRNSNNSFSPDGPEPFQKLSTPPAMLSAVSKLKIFRPAASIVDMRPHDLVNCDNLIGLRQHDTSEPSFGLTTTYDYDLK